MIAEGTLISVVAKYPRPGIAKTRLGRIIGDELATDLVLALMKDLIPSLQKNFSNVTIETDSSESQNLFLKLFVDVPVHSEEVLTAVQRVERVFKRYTGSYEKIVAIFSDVPYLSPHLVRKAVDSLDDFDIVLGPDDGGGCYLFGMKNYCDIFSIPNSGAYFHHLVANINALSKSVSLLDVLFDIDVYSDLEKISPERIKALSPVFYQALLRDAPSLGILTSRDIQPL